MVHIYFITRGHKKFVRRFIEDLYETYVPYKFLHKGKEIEAQTQLCARPVQLWELVYPKPEEQKVLNLLGNDANPQNKYHHAIKKIISKMLGLKPIPNYEQKWKQQVKGVSIHLLGIKDDDFGDISATGDGSSIGERL